MTTTWSQYDQLEYSTDRWNFLLGGRFDYVRLTQGGQKSIDPLLIFSPRANVRFNPTKDLSLRLSYSEGFRAPQFFDEEMHARWQVVKLRSVYSQQTSRKSAHVASALPSLVHYAG